MKKRCIRYLLSFLFLGIPLVSVQAQESAKEASVAQPEAVIEIVGNKTCPVTGRPIPKKDLGKYTVTYQGKIVNLCSPDCKKEFMKDPDAYLARAQKSVDEEKPDPSDSSQAEPGGNFNDLEDGPLMDETDNGPAS